MQATKHRLRAEQCPCPSQEEGFFDRTSECQVLKRYLESEPSAVLLIVGPRSSGKTALLQKVCSSLPNDGQAYPPSYLNGRAQQLSDAGELKKALQASGNSALSQLSERLAAFANSPLGKAFAAVTGKEQVAGGNFSISGDKIISAFLRQEDQTINDVIAVYNDMLAVYKSAKVSNSSWPVICIDEANVLTEWHEGSVEDQRALKALLKFFIKVSVHLQRCPNSKHGDSHWHQYDFEPFL